jgi:hypothetical protein
MQTKTGWSKEKVFFYAQAKGGLMGESRHDYADRSESYPLSSGLARLVACLLADGHIEARIVTRSVPEERGTGFLDCAAHVLVSTTYHATEAGRVAWLAQVL